ncbi:MAG: TolC family protein, partial [Chlamydiae bacterium]|nr:TolC family protein [Chlamydiota bacterium]
MAVSLKELGGVFFVIYFSSCQFYSSVEPPKPSIHQAYLSECNFQADSKKHFFDQFQDEYLIEILRLAVKNNQDLQIALERIHEAEFFYGVEASKSYPSVSVDVDAQRTRSS